MQILTHSAYAGPAEGDTSVLVLANDANALEANLDAPSGLPVCQCFGGLRGRAGRRFRHGRFAGHGFRARAGG